MNNQQFRRLVLDKPSASTASTAGAADSHAKNPSSTPSLGSRQRSSMPMTPRTLNPSSSNSLDFARQVRAAQQSEMAPPAAKRFKSSAAPKGSRLAAGYTDRAAALRDGTEDGGGDDKEARLRALDEQAKLGQISAELHAALRDEIAGGDAASVHLVKGLDRRLLARVRRGEDVLGLSGGGGGGGEGTERAQNGEGGRDGGEKEEERVQEEPEDVDAALAALEAQATAPRAIDRDRAKAPAAPRKRTRADILRELKAARAEAQEAEPKEKKPEALGPRFRKVADRLRPGESRLELDARGREVLVTALSDGSLKRRVRKAKAAEPGVEGVREGMPVLGADVVVPEAPRAKDEEDEDDGDIFGGVGAEYDPLAGLDGGRGEDGSGSSSESESEGEDDEVQSRPRRPSESSGASSSSPRRSSSRDAGSPRRRRRSDESSFTDSRSRSRSRTPPPPRRRQRSRSHSAPRSHSPPRRRPASRSASHSRTPPPRRSSPPPHQPGPPAGTARNYFATGGSSSTAADASAAPPADAAAKALTDPAMLAALQRAARIAGGGGDDPAAKEEAARQARRREMLANVDRDAQDMDAGFGGSRVEDGEDDGRRVRLSEWGAEEGSAPWKERGGQSQRKRGKKKKRNDG